MKNFSVKILSLITAAVTVLSLCSCSFGKEKDGFEKEFFAMDTSVDIRLKCENCEETYKQIEELVSSLDKDFLSPTSTTSSIYKVNKNGGGEVDPKLVGYLLSMIVINNKSGGAFNFCMGSLSELWGFGKENPAVPSAKKIKELVNACDKGAIAVDPGTREITFSSPLLKLDMGAAGKGIALDEIKNEILAKSNVTECVAAVGGSILLYGERNFSVGIKDPNGAGYIAVLTLPPCCVSTSGNYERYFEKNGKRYHHILDPETGYPVENGLAGVTVISENGTVSDALSTACFVKGINNSAGLLKEFNCSAVFVTEDKKIYTTKGIADKIEITDSSYTLVKADEK